MKQSLITMTMLLLLACINGRAFGAEGGSGEYLPGYLGIMAGYVPPESGFYFGNDIYYYTAHASRVSQGGRFSLGVDADIALDIPTLTYITPAKVFGANYGFSITQAFGYVNMDADFSVPGLDRSADTFGLADTVITPVILGWHQGELHWNALLNVYAPTGQYDDNQPINLSKHFWAVEPMACVTYLNTTGQEVSAAFGYTINSENTKTDYRSGDVFHVDVAVAQYLSKQLKVGLVGYAWVQVTSDTGSGATLGDFNSEVYGVGPAVDYVATIGKTNLDLQFKWYHEFESNNRLEGDAFYLNCSFAF